ncbi:MAG: HAMP domain-containing sensor histidine kinase [Pseudomonadota bacterium]
MIGRWSFLVRVGAIFAIGLFALQLLIVVLIFAQRSRDTGTGFRYPLPDQTAAMVEMLEAGADRGTLLRAVNSHDLSVSIEPGPIETYTAEPVRLEQIERVIGRYADRLGERGLAAFIALPPGQEEVRFQWTNRGLWTRWPLKIAIALSTGEVLVIETRGGDLTGKLFSWPLGLFSGMVSLAVALVVLLAVRRETRPLRQLAKAAREFSEGGAPQPVPVTGAVELRNLLQAFNDMQTRIGDLLTSRTLMLGALGHDLRTYITRLRLRVDRIEETEIRRAAERDLDQVSALIDDGVALARLGIDGPGGERTEIIGLIAGLAAGYREEGAKLHLALASTAPLTVAGGTEPLRRLFGNLIDNALKYGSGCWITERQKGADVVVEIADDGPGVAPEDLANIKRPFYRSDAARTLRADGHGLGLAIANEIAISIGGRLDLVSQPGAGLTCTVRVPKAC